jgi:hypothetical protein
LIPYVFTEQPEVRMATMSGAAVHHRVGLCCVAVRFGRIGISLKGSNEHAGEGYGEARRTRDADD